MTGLRMAFARACVETRISLDLTQQQVAARVGVSRSYIAKVERGGIDPKLSMVERIAEALGFELELRTARPVFPADALSGIASTPDARHMSIAGSRPRVGSPPARSRSSTGAPMAGSICWLLIREPGRF